MVAVWSRCGRDVVVLLERCAMHAPCIRHAPYCDVQDANEMRTVENAKRNETYGTDTGQIRDDSDITKHRHSEWVAVGIKTTKRLDGVRG